MVEPHDYEHTQYDKENEDFAKINHHFYVLERLICQPESCVFTRSLKYNGEDDVSNGTIKIRLQRSGENTLRGIVDTQREVSDFTDIRHTMITFKEEVILYLILAAILDLLDCVQNSLLLSISSTCSF